MNSKTWNILLAVFLTAFVISLFTVSITLGRFSDERDSESHYSGTIDYVVSDQVEIESVDQFFSAIENGYSNIKIADGVNNPLVISGGMSDVSSDMVIDLNGHELQRNNREPLLNITQGVRLTIVDSSDEKTGSFYNPVGSVLQISGGTLTVADGTFESGPRFGESSAWNGQALGGESEYVFYNAASSRYETPAGAYIHPSYTVSSVYDSQDREYMSVSMPVIIPHVQPVEAEGETRYTVNGNMYFQTAYPTGGANTFITADSYVYFTLDDSTVENTTITAGEADYHYTYYLKKDTFAYADPQPQLAPGEQSDEYMLITVYIYNNVKNAANASDRFAAIRMMSGNLYVRGGVYHSYFGVDNTYCVNASGGYMSIEKGEFFSYGQSVCVECAYNAADSSEEFLSISSGSFYSEIGNTVGVSGGRMVVSSATFTKNATQSGSASERNQNGSAIFVSGGELNVTSNSAIAFSLYGSGMSGITATGANASVFAENVAMNFYSGMSDDGKSLTDPKNISFNTGIFADGGTVTCNGNTQFYVIGAYSSGIYSSNGTININGDSFACDVNMDSTDTLLSSTAISSVGGSINFSIQQASIVSNGLGLTVGGGNINFSHTQQETVSVTTTRGSAIYVYDGEIDIDEGSTLHVTSTIDPNCRWALDTSGGSTADKPVIPANINNGVYINGGSFLSYGSLEITHTGVPNEGESDSKIKSYAIRVDGKNSDTVSSFEATNVIIDTVNDGGGLYVNQGSITVGTADIETQGFGIAMRGSAQDEVTINEYLTLTSQKATGIYITGGSLVLEGQADITSSIDSTYPFCTNDAQTSYDGIFVRGGSLEAKNGNFKVTHTGLPNDSQVTWSNKDTMFRDFVIKSYAVRVLSGDAPLKVEIAKGEIVNQIVTEYVNGIRTTRGGGGGIYVEAAGGDQVILGDSSESLTVKATGSDVGNSFWGITGADANWAYKENLRGGHAVEVNGGQLTIYGGTFTSEQGEGILVKNGTVTISGGKFVGKDSYSPNGDAHAGPAASYSLKVFGGTANISGGTFGESTADGSGAFVMGNSQNDVAKVNISGGTFEVAGQAGFSVCEFADITFTGDPSVKGNACAIAIENRTGSTKLTIEGGTFEGTGRGGNYNAIWYSNSEAVLNISGGNFTGNASNGLQFAKSPDYQNGTYNVQLSGGTFTGPAGALGGTFSSTAILAPGCSFVGNYNDRTCSVVANAS